MTLPAKVRLEDGNMYFPGREYDPIRFRKTVPTAWLELIIYEGRNRQVRKMTAAVGHPTLRLVRWQMATLTLDHMNPGRFRELYRSEVDDLRESLRFPGWRFSLPRQPA